MKAEIHDPSDDTCPAEAAGESAARGPGRPTKRTPELEAAIFECLQLGLTIAETCGVCGVSETQFRIWRQHYPDFAAMVRRGQAEAVKTHLSIIREAAGKRWQASAWWLERRCPQTWGRTERRTYDDIRVCEQEEDITEEMIQTIREQRATIDELRRELDERTAAGSAASGSEPEVSIPAEVPETAAGFEDEDPGSDAREQGFDARQPGDDARQQARRPDTEDREIISQSLPSPPPPCAVKTPAVFICGARHPSPDARDRLSLAGDRATAGVFAARDGQPGPESENFSSYGTNGN